jgi:hypothetical protein
MLLKRKFLYPLVSTTIANILATDRQQTNSLERLKNLFFRRYLILVNVSDFLKSPEFKFVTCICWLGLFSVIVSSLAVCYLAVKKLKRIASTCAAFSTRMRSILITPSISPPYFLPLILMPRELTFLHKEKEDFIL